MRNIFFLAILLLTLTMCNKKTNYKAPLIDRELFFGNPEISNGKLSPDGEWISFMKEYDGIMNVWIKAFDEPFENARPLTDSKRPLYGYFWTIDGKYILYAKDKDGDENINIFAFDPTEGTKDKLPESRNLTPLDEVTARIYQVSDIDADLFFIGLNDRDKAWHDLYSLKISTGDLELIFENKDRITSYNFDWEDNLKLLSKTDDKGNTVTLRINEDKSLTPIYETTVDEQAYVAGWTPDNSQFYLVSNVGDLDLSTLFLMNPKTEDITKIESDPEGRVDFGGLSLNKNTREIISTSYTDDKTRKYWQDEIWEENYNFLKEQFPGREISFQSSTKDYSKFLVALSGDKYASESYFFDAETKELIFQYTPRPDLKEVEEFLSPMEPILYKSSDGLEIPAYLTTPYGFEAKNLPVVVLVHGGPKGPRDYWGYNPIVQFLANRGYAVLQPNFRASGGYGKSFMNAGDLQWGKLMQDDITWGVQHLIDEGIANKEKIVIMGGSYGGYATLAGLAFTPDLYAAGVDIVGPSNIFTLLESIPAYWEAGRAYLHAMVGDPDTEEGKKLIKEASPLFFVDNIDKPLLIIQGANDPRVKQAESDQIVIALRDKGKKVSYLLAEDEGHGFAKPDNRMAMFAEVERFLAEVIGGRFQEDMPENIAEKLNEIRVDIDLVTLEEIEEISLSKTLLTLYPNLKETSLKYKMAIEVQGKEMEMEMNRKIAKEDGNWIITDKVKSMMMSSTDKMVYNELYQPQSRLIEQMGQNITMKFNENSIQIDAMGKNIDLELEGAYFTDGPGMDLMISGLPLEKGYQLAFLVPDAMNMKVKEVFLNVLNEEKIDEKETWKVTIISVENNKDKTTLWIDKATKKALKTEQIVPAMGNAIMTLKLIE